MLRPRTCRRRGNARGFSLIEVTVALAVMAMTIMLLSGAAFSLRLVSERSVRADAALELLTVRRLLRAWTSATMLRGPSGEASFVGDGSDVRMLLARDDLTGTPRQLARLSVERRDGISVLLASRAQGGKSVWQSIGSDTPLTSEIYRTKEPMRFSYLASVEVGQTLAWVAAKPAGAPPRGLALTIGEERRIVAFFEQEIDAGCLALVGLGTLQRRQCEVQ
ncbi:MAG: type II secretion system protein [Pseudomonadota bacterium]